MEDYNNNTLASPAMEGEEQEGGGIKFKEIYALLVLNWKWFVLSLFVCLACAFVYLRYTTPIYQVTARMLIKDEGNKRRSSSSIANMEDFGFISNSNGVDNEIELLKSLTLGRKAVMDLKLYTKYWKEGRVKKQLLYGNQPINIDLDPMSLELMDETGLPVTMNVRQEGKAYLVEGMAYRADRRTGMAVEAPFTATVNVLPYSFRTAAVLASSEAMAMSATMGSLVSLATSSWPSILYFSSCRRISMPRGKPMPTTMATSRIMLLLGLTLPIIWGESMSRPLSAVAASEMEFSSRFWRSIK